MDASRPVLASRPVASSSSAAAAADSEQPTTGMPLAVKASTAAAAAWVLPDPGRPAMGWMAGAAGSHSARTITDLLGRQLGMGGEGEVDVLGSGGRRGGAEPDRGLVEEAALEGEQARGRPAGQVDAAGPAAVAPPDQLGR